MKIKIKLIEGGRLPEYKTDGAVCADCYSRCKNPIEIKPNSRALIPLGLEVQENDS
jgi:dUTPase